MRSAARYLIRFDDICPTMKWSIWDRLEAALREHKIRPIVSVVPDNQDTKLHFEEADPHFWDRVREWQSRGWTIGMHGHQHVYTSSLSGITGIKPASEFAGVPEEIQLAKLQAAAAIFREQKVTPGVWVAPGHSFDAVTVGLLPSINIRSISDGLFFSPRVDSNGIIWVPQQLWAFRRLPFGLWTVCLHPNRWSDRQLAEFIDELAAYKSNVITFAEAVDARKHLEPGRIDGFVPAVFRTVRRFKATFSNGHR